MEKDLMLQEMENEMLLTGFGFDNSAKIKPNLDFDKNSSKKEKSST